MCCSPLSRTPSYPHFSSHITHHTGATTETVTVSTATGSQVKPSDERNLSNLFGGWGGDTDTAPVTATAGSGPADVPNNSSSDSKDSTAAVALIATSTTSKGETVNVGGADNDRDQSLNSNSIDNGNSIGNSSTCSKTTTKSEVDDFANMFSFDAIGLGIGDLSTSESESAVTAPAGDVAVAVGGSSASAVPPLSVVEATGEVEVEEAEQHIYSIVDFGICTKLDGMQNGQKVAYGRPGKGTSGYWAPEISPDYVNGLTDLSDLQVRLEEF